ncbi:MAG: hypothetical protein V4674_00760 [Patescibacteria group bacterium]
MKKNWLFGLGVLVIVIAAFALWKGNEANMMPSDESSLGATTTEDGAPVTATAPKKPLLQSSYSKTGRDAKGVVTVTYTDKGFTPFLVEVKLGESVKFVNGSSRALWVTSYGHPTAKDQFYPGFDTGKSIAKGQSWTFNFGMKGAWGYKNLNNERDLGAVVVTP